MRRSLVTVALAITIACATNPATGRRQLILLPEADEIQLGRQADTEIRQEMGAYDNAQLQNAVDRIGQRLARASHRPGLPWKFTVVDEAAVNAFALPGGFVYVTRGILPFLRNEAELAAVLGHEIGHVDAKHGVDQYSRQLLTEGALAGASILLPKWQAAFGGLGVAAQFVFLKYGRTAELESDQLGVGYASAAGWQPAAMQGVLATLGRLDSADGSRRGVPNWALSHPPAEDRVLKVSEAVAAATGKGGATNQPEFERLIDGIVVGDSREKGMVRGSEFVHPVMRFSLRFPDDWGIVNSASQVSARHADQPNALLILEISNQRTSSVLQAARADMADTGFKEVRSETTRINGLEAHVGLHEGVMESVPVRLRVAHIRSGDQIYRVAGLATSDEFARADRLFQATMQSFQSLSGAEAARIQPSRLRFAVVQGGDTWESLARRAGPFGGPSPTALAIMNNADPAAPPRPGTRIRVVVGG